MTYRQAFLLTIAASMCSCAKEPTLTDTTPPWIIGDLTVQARREGFHLRWTATGDDGNQGRASHYDVRYATNNLEASWESAQIVSNLPTPSLPGHADSVRVPGIGAGPWEFGIKIGDNAGNWSRLSNVVIAAVDTIPPAAITTLGVRGTNRGFYLTWTATGDDGMQGQASRYDIRYVTGDLANRWGTAIVLPSPPMPRAAGHADSASILGSGVGPWEFGIRTADEGENWSSLSNVVTATVNDLTPPAPVTDLGIDMVTERSVVLDWTASGDDGRIGQAWAYDIRYADAPITPETWAVAIQAAGPKPRPSGERELFTIQGLQKGITYYFALVVIDDAENSSDLSNLVGASTSTPVQITFNTEQYRGPVDPDWSPDGLQLACSGRWQNQPYGQIYAVPSKGGTVTRYTSFLNGAGAPTWSPDGRKFAFIIGIEEEGSTRTAIATMDAVPEAASQILADPGVQTAGPVRWSPDGTSIAYVATTWFIGLPAVSQVYSIPSAGGQPQPLYGGWAVAGLDWSPDGTQLVYSSEETGNFDIWMMPSSGSAGKRLTDSRGSERSPVWSPDGTKIAYEGDGQIWIIHLPGGGLTQVTFDEDKKVFRGITWSPDGTAIAYGASEGSVYNLWVVRVK